MRAGFLLSIAFLSVFSLKTVFCFSQQKFKVTYDQLTEFEGRYQYVNGSTLIIAASPVDTLLYAFIGDGRYPLRPSAKDLFLNSSKDKVLFLRNISNAVTSYTVGKDTFNLLDRRNKFVKEIWYPRVIGSKGFNYVYRQPKNDNDGMKTGHLDKSGLDATLLSEMMYKIVGGIYPGIHSVLIIKDGKLVFEEYFYEYTKDSLHQQRSATKSFISALAGIAIDKGFIKSKNESVVSYFPEYSLNHFSEAKKRITIEHLLTNQSGLDCDIANPKSEGNETVMGNSDDWVKFTLDLPMTDSAGGKGMYCSGNPITLGRIIEKTTRLSLPDFARQTMFKDLGINSFKWHFQPDKSSSETFCQLYLRPRDMAKFGLLYLNKGFLKGNSIIPADWVTQSLKKHSLIQNVNYGYLWWIKYLDVGGVRYYGKAAQGNGGQRIFIWEEQNLVTVITGGNYNSQSSSDELIQKYILPVFNKK